VPKRKEGNIINKLNAFKFGIAGGIVYALLVFFIIVFASYFPTWESLINECYKMFGYTSSNLLGIILGVVYAFIDGFILTSVFAWIYNKLL